MGATSSKNLEWYPGHQTGNLYGDCSCGRARPPLGGPAKREKLERSITSLPIIELTDMKVTSREEVLLVIQTFNRSGWPAALFFAFFSHVRNAANSLPCVVYFSRESHATTCLSTAVTLLRRIHFSWAFVHSSTVLSRSHLKTKPVHRNTSFPPPRSGPYFADQSRIVRRHRSLLFGISVQVQRSQRGGQASASGPAPRSPGGSIGQLMDGI